MASHFQQFGSYDTKMSDDDRETLQIADSKIVQAKIDSQPRENALQAAAEETVSFTQLGIRQGSISEAAFEAIDLSTFEAKEGISGALSLVEEAKVGMDKLEPGPAARTIHRHP